MNKLIILNGYDGSGKTCIIQSLQTHGFNTSSFFDIFQVKTSLFFGTKFKYSELESRKSKERAYYLIERLDYWINNFILNRYDSIIIDSYIYKYIEKEKLFNKEAIDIYNQYLNNTIIPSICINLNVSTATSYQRNSRLHKSDIWPGSENPLKGYKKLQEYVFTNIIDFLSAHDCIIKNVDANQNAEAVSNSVIEIVKNQNYDL